MDDDDDVEVVGERGACITVAMELDIGMMEWRVRHEAC